MVGAIRVHEEGSLIHVSGIPTYAMAHDISKYWDTSKIGKWMFTHLGQNSLSFEKFFAPDFVFTLQNVIDNHHNQRNVRVMRKILELMYEHTWLAQTKVALAHRPLDLKQLKVLNVEMLPKQLEFLKLYDEIVPAYMLRGYLLAAAPGTGKTLSGIALAECAHSDMVICVVPKNSVEEVWKKTLDTRFHQTPSYWYSTSGETIEPGRRYYVGHYESLGTLVSFFRARSRNYRKVTILLDESHNFNELDAQRTQLFIELCSFFPQANVLWESGTPVKAIGAEMIPLLKTIDPLFNADTENRFKNLFGRNATRAVEILSHRMGIVSFKVDKSDVVKLGHVAENVPVKIPGGERYTLKAIRAEMETFITAQMRYYEENMDQFVATFRQCVEIHRNKLFGENARLELDQYLSDVEMLRKSYNPVLHRRLVVSCNKYELNEIVPSLPQNLRAEFKTCRSVVKYYWLKVQGEALGRVLGRKRVQCHIELVKHAKLDQYVETAEKKTVIFSSYVEVVDTVRDWMIKEGYKPAVVYGETNKDLPAIVTQFDRNEDINPLVATFQSLSSAVPLIMASTVVLTNSPFRSHEYEQAIARLDRLGQDTLVSVYNLLLDTGEEPNISTRSQDIMRWSEEQVAAIMGRTVALDVNVAMESFDKLEEFAEPAAPIRQPAWSAW